jgi:Flp pilus assembly protein TadG
MSKGQSFVELALVLPVLMFLVLVAADFGRFCYVQIAVNGAARAGAQFASQSVITAADTSGIIRAAQLDASSVPSLTAVANQCTCASPSSVPACPTSYCASDAQATFVQVDAQAPFQTLVHYPGIPASLVLDGTATMQVAQ